jgi:predicted homoserine dehydrogenase-like protein
MNLHALATARAQSAGPIGVGLIGAGKFASMFLAQVPTMPGLKIVAIADLKPDAARDRLAQIGWSEERIAAVVIGEAAADVISRDDVDVVIEATGDPLAGLAHGEAAIAAGKHLVMVNVEADVLAGPALAAKARAAGLVYALAYGDQPALIAEQVDWARAAGFEVAAAGKGTKYLPDYHASTPDTVWQHYGLTAEQAHAAGMNSQMFNSFLDGTKSAIEMAAVANACGLGVPAEGLLFPPVGTDKLADILRPKALGGVLERDGMVETISSLNRDGSEIDRDLRWGVYVVMKATNDYASACFAQYGLPTDETGQYSALYRPYHLIGLELGISVYCAVLRGEATGAPTAFRGDVAAVAKRDLKAGERLDGEGGFTVWGKLLPAERSLAIDALPIGLAKDVVLTRDAAAGTVLSAGDVSLTAEPLVAALRAKTTMMAAE